MLPVAGILAHETSTVTGVTGAMGAMGAAIFLTSPLSTFPPEW